jgi:nucleotide-binding universal stress UspA family protein
MQLKILVGVDATPAAWCALDEALRFAQQTKALVVALLVESPFWSPPPMGRSAFEAAVQAFTERKAASYGVPLAFRVRRGFPAHTIAEQARLLQCDLVVLGHAERGRLAHWLDACVSDLVRYEAPCRVVVVHTGEMLALDEAHHVVVTRMAQAAQAASVMA